MNDGKMDKNWRVTYFKKPFEERKTPQDFSGEEWKFDNYEDAEEKATEIEGYSESFDVTITIFEGDAPIDIMI